MASVFEVIDEQNGLVTEARTSGDPVLRAKVKGLRIVGPATKQRIRATLRSALNSYIKQNPGVPRPGYSSAPPARTGCMPCTT